MEVINNCFQTVFTRESEFVEVLHGLSGNEEVIVSGQMNLNSGDDVLVVK